MARRKPVLRTKSVLGQGGRGPTPGFRYILEKVRDAPKTLQKRVKDKATPRPPSSIPGPRWPKTPPSFKQPGVWEEELRRRRELVKTYKRIPTKVKRMR